MNDFMFCTYSFYTWPWHSACMSLALVFTSSFQEVLENCQKHNIPVIYQSGIKSYTSSTILWLQYRPLIEKSVIHKRAENSQRNSKESWGIRRSAMFSIELKTYEETVIDLFQGYFFDVHVRYIWKYNKGPAVKTVH